MKQWYAKELSKLTKVSVRTLHHYDKIDLLKPELRLRNGYRLYSEKDLLRLQQIIALKFFGFDLAQIKVLLTKQDDVLENLALQSKFLQEKAQSLLEASRILMRITNNCGNKKSIPWQQIIQSIEVYHMAQQLENEWVQEIFNANELKQYSEFEAGLKSRFTEEEKSRFEANWFKLVEKVNKNLQHDPRSQIGIEFAKESMDIINGLYGKEHANLRATKWQKGFKEGKGLKEHGLTPEIVNWLDKALIAYWMQRIYEVLAQSGKLSPDQLLLTWNELMDEMYGNDEQNKSAILSLLLQDDKISELAKNWLKKIVYL